MSTKGPFPLSLSPPTLPFSFGKPFEGVVSPMGLIPESCVPPIPRPTAVESEEGGCMRVLGRGGGFG